jgi:hypothetical protein
MDRNHRIYQGAGQINLSRFNEIFQNIIITSYFETGNIIEKWSLKGLWPLGFENSDLSYEDDGIRKFSFEVDYKTAEYSHFVSNREHTIFKYTPKQATTDSSRLIEIGGRPSREVAQEFKVSKSNSDDSNSKVLNNSSVEDLIRRAMLNGSAGK